MVIFGQARHFPSLGCPREKRETNFILSKNSESINPRRNLYQEKALLTNYFRKMNKRTVSSRGGSRIIFRRGCTLLLLYFNTNKPHSFFFFCRIPVVLENRRSSQGSGGAHPLHPPPKSAPE